MLKIVNAMGKTEQNKGHQDTWEEMMSDASLLITFQKVKE